MRASWGLTARFGWVGERPTSARGNDRGAAGSASVREQRQQVGRFGAGLRSSPIAVGAHRAGKDDQRSLTHTGVPTDMPNHYCHEPAPSDM